MDYQCIAFEMHVFSIKKIYYLLLYGLEWWDVAVVSLVIVLFSNAEANMDFFGDPWNCLATEEEYVK